jgi:hypothetical protein
MLPLQKVGAKSKGRSCVVRHGVNRLGHRGDSTTKHAHQNSKRRPDDIASRRPELPFGTWEQDHDWITSASVPAQSVLFCLGLCFTLLSYPYKTAQPLNTASTTVTTTTQAQVLQHQARDAHCRRRDNKSRRDPQQRWQAKYFNSLCQ